MRGLLLSTVASAVLAFGGGDGVDHPGSGLREVPQDWLLHVLCCQVLQSKVLRVSRQLHLLPPVLTAATP